jgi:integrase
MAWLEKRQNGYLVRWREPSGRVASAKRRTYDEARSLKAEMESAILKGSYVAQEARKLPFGEYAKMVLDSDLNLGRTTRANYDTCLRLQLDPLSYVPIELVDSGRVRSLFAGLSASGASPHTLHMTKKVLSKVCSIAVEDGILNRNPAASVRLPKLHRRQVEPLTPEQVKDVSESLPGRYKAVVLLGAWGGLRISEIGALTRDDVDWERGSVTISKSQSRFGEKQAKTKASNRTVTLPGWVMKELAAHILKYVEGGVPAEGLPGDKSVGSHATTAQGQPPSAHLFTTGTGKPLNAMTMSKIMQKVGVKFHDLRHTQAALLIKSGANPLEIKERMGHASIKTTYDIYGWLFPEAHDKLARTLEQYQPPDEMGKVVEM